MESLVIQSHGDTIGINDIIQFTGERDKANLPKDEILEDINLKEKTAEFEKGIITKYFKKYGSVKETAQALGCEQSTISKKIKKYKIQKWKQKICIDKQICRKTYSWKKSCEYMQKSIEIETSKFVWQKNNENIKKYSKVWL